MTYPYNKDDLAAIRRLKAYYDQKQVAALWFWQEALPKDSQS